MSLPIRSLLRARRRAMADGELRWMWPGGVWDVASLVWWRGIWFPVTNRFRGPHPDAVFHSPTGGCPLCNPARSHSHGGPIVNSPVLGLGCHAQVRELLARAMHDANTGKICPDPDDPTRYGVMADAVMSEIAPLIGQYEDALRRLVALPHPVAIPRWWRPQDSHHEPLTLTDVVDVLWRHVPPNSVGAPPPPSPEAMR